MSGSAAQRVPERTEVRRTEGPFFTTKRLLSLDVFRGATIASMILVNNSGDFSNTYAPLLHADWNGWTFTDTVFPFFLWIAGVAMTLSFAKRMERGDDRGSLLLHAGQRAAIIFALGLMMNGFPSYDVSTLRIPGVLQRIAVCYFVAAAIFLYTRLRGQVIALAALLGGYWALMMLAPVPGYGPGVLEKQGNFAQWVDSLFLTGHMYSRTKIWDPEGIVSTLPAIGTVLFGILAGHVLRAARDAQWKTSVLLGGGAALVALGQILNIWLPINKNLWTTSYAVLMAGLASVAFGLSYFIVDVKGRQAWSRPFAIYGMNAIAVYVFAGLLARILSITNLSRPIFLNVFAPLASPRNAALLYALSFVLICYLLAWMLHRRGWYLKV